MAEVAVAVAVAAANAKAYAVGQSKSHGREARIQFRASFFCEWIMITLFALSHYWQGFVDHWTSVFGKQSGFTMAIIGCGVVGILIIISGRKKLDT